MKSKLFLATAVAFALSSFGGVVAQADSSTNTQNDPASDSIDTSNLHVDQLISANSGIPDVASQEAPSIASTASLLSSTRVVKSFYFDRGPFGDTNFHNYQYIHIPASSRKTGYTNQKVGSGWNYVRFEHINYYSGGY